MAALSRMPAIPVPLPGADLPLAAGARPLSTTSTTRRSGW